jgi:ATP-dependent Clp protease adaptor protein ClpS
MGTLTQSKNQEKVQESITSEYVLIVHNDDHNTFPHVIKSLMTYCDHSPDQAEQVAHIVHFTGKCDVKRGDKDKITKIYNKLKSAGLTVTMETN